jgi:hypothetical protein
MSNFHFGYRVHDSSGEVKNSQGRCKRISGEVRTSPHLPSKSGHGCYGNLTATSWERYYYLLKNITRTSTFRARALRLLSKYVHFGQIVINLKAMLHGAIFLATCNAILLLKDVKLPNTSIHYTLLMFSQHIENSSLISLINISQE